MLSEASNGWFERSRRELPGTRPEMSGLKVSANFGKQARGDNPIPVDQDGPPRSPRSALRVARDRPFRACGEQARRSGLKCMCPRRQRVSPSVAPLAGFRVPALGAACAVARHTAARVRGDSRAGHGPAVRAGHERAYSAGCSLRAGRRAVLDGRPPRARSRSRPQGAREGASESAQTSLSGCRRGNPRCKGIAVSGA